MGSPAGSVRDTQGPLRLSSTTLADLVVRLSHTLSSYLYSRRDFGQPGERQARENEGQNSQASGPGAPQGGRERIDAIVGSIAIVKRETWCSHSNTIG